MGERGKASCCRCSERVVHSEPWLPLRFLVDRRLESGRAADGESAETWSGREVLLESAGVPFAGCEVALVLSEGVMTPLVP